MKSVHTVIRAPFEPEHDFIVCRACASLVRTGGFGSAQHRALLDIALGRDGYWSRFVRPLEHTTRLTACEACGAIWGPELGPRDGRYVIHLIPHQED